MCSSDLKSLGLPGERIGYLALSPRLEDAVALRRACGFSNRVLGFINAPAIWQWVMLEAADAAIDIAPYEHKRNVLCDALATMDTDGIYLPPKVREMVAQRRATLTKPD